jgi:hypothetical protein
MAKATKKSNPQEKQDNRVMVRLKDFSGGLNDNNSPNLLNDNEVSELKNFCFDDKGVLKVRGGLDKRYSELLGKEIIAMYPYYKKDGTTRLMLATQDALYYDLPRHVTKFDSQSEFDTGTYANTKASTDGKVTTTPVTATFTRDAVVKDENYADVTKNTPRYKDSVSGKCLDDTTTGEFNGTTPDYSKLRLTATVDHYDYTFV